MSKKLCEIKQLLKKDLGEYAKLVRDPKFICKSCGRVANKKALLCDPVKLK